MKPLRDVTKPRPYYKLKLRCMNCGRRVRYRIKRGQSAEGYVYDRTCCYCGCKTLAKPQVNVRDFIKE